MTETNTFKVTDYNGGLFQSWIRLLIALSALITLASGQTVTVGGNLTNTIQNSGNSFKPISKNSGNVFKNQYQIDVNSGDEEEEGQNEVETEKNNGNPDVLRQLDLLQRVSQSDIRLQGMQGDCMVVEQFLLTPMWKWYFSTRGLY